MAVKNQILTTLKPTIPLRDMSMVDFDSLNQKNNSSSGSASSYAESTGGLVPLVRIADSYTLGNDNIVSLEISQSGFLPTLKLTMYDDNHMFTNMFYPFFDPIVSVYIKSQVPQLKPVRCDFLITNVNSMVESIEDGNKLYTIEGELYVPRLYDNVSKSYSKMTSAECLKTVATDLGLGYASNEEQLGDRMTWINPNMSYYMFMRDEVTKRAYKSDKSFFTCFIDRYYILNFVNVERQMEQDMDFDISNHASNSFKTGSLLKDGSVTAGENAVTTEIVLSNHVSMNGSVNFINNYKLSSLNGNILKNNSFRKRVYWYDRKNGKVQDFFIEPISNLQTKSGGEHQKPVLTDLQTMEVKKWIGSDQGNTHANAKFAQTLNFHNNSELLKNILHVQLNSINPIIMRGSRVPVAIYNDTYYDALRKGALGQTDLIIEPNHNKLFLDDLISDLYYVRDIVYKYDVFATPDPFSTEIILAKRNWKKQVFT